MPKKWTGDLVGLMHVNRISKKTLAEHMEVTPEYVSMVLNGHREPSDAKEKFRTAINELISIQKNDSK